MTDGHKVSENRFRVGGDEPPPPPPCEKIEVDRTARDVLYIL